MQVFCENSELSTAISVRILNVSLTIPVADFDILQYTACMAFEVTATRRRPQQFEDLVGQEFVAETLKNSITSKQIAHAYLFSGPRGCGKTSTARILAKALNCESGPTATPCGTCTRCKEITSGSSLDVIEIDGASNTSVNDVRQIKDEVLFPPNASRYKIYIIDEVHMLSTSAFNALLKTIEEPPPYVVFIFATTELQKVPATIKSRCQQFTFRLVSVEKIKQLLASAAAELNIQADDEALYWIARESTGSVRDAYTLFDQVAAFSDSVITYEKIRDKLGLVGVDKLNELFETCAAGKSDDALSVLDDYLQSGVSIEQLIANSTNYIRSLLLIKNGITKEALLGNSPERYSQNVVAAWNTVQVERALSIFLQLYRDMRYSLSPRYELELAFSRLCWLSQYVSPAEVKLAIDNARALLGDDSAHGSSVLVGRTVNTSDNSVGDANAGGSASSAANASDYNGVTSNAINADDDNKVDSVNAGVTGNTAAVVNTVNSGMCNSVSSASNAIQDAAQTAASRVRAMPHFAVFDELTKSAAETQHVDVLSQPNSQSSAGQTWEAQSTGMQQAVQSEIQAACPFYDGGAVPPEQMAENQWESDEWEDNGAPDEEYVPHDEYSSENLSHEIRSNANALQSSQLYTMADGRTIAITQLRDSVIAELSSSDVMTATALMQTNSWQITGNVITACIGAAYQKTRIDQQKNMILQALAKLCGQPVDFSVQLVEVENRTHAIEIPQQVKILQSVFKGSIIGGKQ